MNYFAVEIYLITLLWISSFTIVYFTNKMFTKRLKGKYGLFFASFIPCCLFATVSFGMINFMMREVNMLASVDTIFIMFYESLPTAFIFGGIPLILLINKRKPQIHSSYS